MSSNSCILGYGIKIKENVQLDEGTSLKPYKIEKTHMELQKLTVSKQQYGFVCALSDLITFKLECLGDTPKEMKINLWNAQWSLILLSLIIKRAIFFPLLKETKDKKEYFILANSYFNAAHESYLLKEEEIENWKRLYPAFKNLTDNHRFTYACSIAATHYMEWKTSIKIASIWSAIEALIGLDQELTFRISLFVAKFLGNSEKDIKKRYSETKKLYSDRSKCVHGAGLKTAREQEVYKASLNLLSELLIKIMEQGRLPDKDHIEKVLLS